MFKIETVKVDPKLYKNHPKYKMFGSTVAAAKHLVDSQGNYTYLGAGAFGTVYGCSDTNIVYKIGDTNLNTSYLSYVRELSRLKKPNKFLPKIYGCKIFKYHRESHFVVAMERLHPGYGRAFFDAADKFEEILRYDETETNTSDLLGIQEIMPKTLIDAVKLVKRAYTRAEDADWDLHHGNFMMRGKNEIVITDPIA